MLWKRVKRSESTTKVPYQPNGDPASSTNDATWSDFASVMGAYLQNINFAGVGFVFSVDDPYVGIDLDKCRDLATGEVEPWAVDMLSRFKTYTELSPSGTGFHLIGKSKLPNKGRRKSQIEMYDSGRYFTVTGDHYGPSEADVLG